MNIPNNSTPNPNIPNIQINLLRSTGEILLPKKGQLFSKNLPVFYGPDREAPPKENLAADVEPDPVDDPNSDSESETNSDSSSSPKQSPKLKKPVNLVQRLAQQPPDQAVYEQPVNDDDDQLLNNDDTGTIQQFWVIIQGLNWTNLSDMPINKNFIQQKVNGWSILQKNIVQMYYPSLFNDLMNSLENYGVFESRKITDIKTKETIVSHFIGLGEEWYSNCMEMSDFVSIIINMEDYQDLHSILQSIQ